MDHYGKVACTPNHDPFGDKRKDSWEELPFSDLRSIWTLSGGDRTRLGTVGT